MPFLRKYNTLLVTGTTSIRIPIIKRAVVDFAVGADWTPGNGDVKTFVDAAGAANITNLPTAIASGNGAFWEFILTAAELSCKQVLVVVADAATKAVEDQSFIVETYGNASAMYAADLSLANLPANLVQILGTAVSTPATAGILDVNVKNIDNDAASASGTVTFPNATLASTTNITAAAGCAVSSIGANVITATSIAADAITDAKVASDVTIASVTGSVGSVTGSVGSVSGSVGSVTGLTASDVGAIKTKTDSLTFTVAGEIDANIEYVNGIQIIGTGQTSDQWGPI